MKDLRLLLIALIMLGAGFLSQSVQPADAAFHLMRIHAVMGGLNGDSTIQYVELRMCAAGQVFIGGHVIDFYDGANILKARFTFPAGTVANGNNGESILMATSEYNAVSYGPGLNGAGGNADYVFDAINTASFNGGDALHPVQSPNGKVVFAPLASDGCDANVGVQAGDVDSVAYGTATADFPSAAVALTTPSDDRALRESNITHSSNNSTDYSLQLTNQTAKNVVVGNLLTDQDTPRNNLREVAQLNVIFPGTNYFETQAGANKSFSGNPIPLSFFDPNSDPFTGTISLDGSPINVGTTGTTDTIINRTTRIIIPSPYPAPQELVPIELVALNLVSINPITVTYNGGSNPEPWNVVIDKSNAQQSLGQLSVTKSTTTGGTFDAMLTVFPRFIFTRVSDSAVRILDTGMGGQPVQYQSTGTPWRHACTTGVLITGSSSNFCAGVNDTTRVLSTLQAPDAQQPILPACPDPDADGLGTCIDNCPNDVNPLQENNDGDALGDICDPDDDNDTILDGADNCPFAANTNQANFDGDAQGDVCDTDDDNDGNPDTTDTDDDNDRVADIAEGPCGGATPSSLRPERLDGVFATVDDDGDTLTDEALPGGSENSDCDGDGYRGDGPGVGNISEKRMYMAAGTANDQDPCGVDGWPADLVTGSGPTANRINLTDLSSFIAPTPRKLGTDPGDPGYDVRWDLVSGNGAGAPKDISVTDISNIAPLLFPPMLLGVKAFGGPVCPWPP